MKLVQFRVQNYKKIRDSGWVTVGDLTVFVGKNESGKSALFRGLSKLNPSDGERYDGLKEFPRRRYTDEFRSQDWPVATGVFALNDSERRALAELCPQLAHAQRVICTRHYSWELPIKFEPHPEVRPVSRQEFTEVLRSIQRDIQELSAPEGKGDALGTIKQHLHQSLEQLRSPQAAGPPDEPVPKHELEKADDIIAQQSNEDWQKELLDPLRGCIKELIERTEMLEALARAKQWVEENLPKFVYFDRYDVIDSAIHLPTFAQQLNQTPPPPKVRTTRCLFEHVGLDVQRLASLGLHQHGQEPNEEIRRLVDERAIHFSSASNAMTQKFQAWWEQRRHKFRYQADGDYFRIWVSDDLDPSEIELDQRSQGMQYFFSFYVVFLVETKGAHANSILLLDEPGLHMHGTAQAKVIKFLERLASENQTLYTTHSPFMMDGDHLERVRVVYEDEEGTTRVSENVWPRDRDSLFPLQAALGYSLVQTLFLAKRQLVVEGLTDFWLLKALDQALKACGRQGLREDVGVVPSGGLSKLFPLASMLIGHDIEVVALLDGDEPGRREGKKLVEKLLGGDDGRCVFIGDFTPNPAGELEDIFPEEYYLSAVGEAYGQTGFSFGPDEGSVMRVAEKVEALFGRLALGEFEKWRAAQVLRDRIMNDSNNIPTEVLDRAGAIFCKVNEAFERQGGL
jgi:energy-coupling factor transporter ATP-binding protein EcfA2